MPPEKSDLTQSKSVQDFLKAVYSLQQGGERVSTNALAEGLAVAAPSVTDMAQRLVSAGLIDYEGRPADPPGDGLLPLLHLR